MVTGRVLVDHQLRPLAVDAMTGQVTGLLDQPVHTYSSASPETRRQLDLDLRTRSNTDVHQWFSLSQSDYASGTVRGSHSWSLGEDQQTTLTAALQFTHQRVNATLDHDVTPYLNNHCWRNSILVSTAAERFYSKNSAMIQVRLGIRAGNECHIGVAGQYRGH